MNSCICLQNINFLSAIQDAKQATISMEVQLTIHFDVSTCLYLTSLLNLIIE